MLECPAAKWDTGHHDGKAFRLGQNACGLLIERAACEFMFMEGLG
jgi:hypothetical protein